MATRRRKRIPAEDLIGPGELQQLLGVSRPTLSDYRARHDFPKPWKKLDAVDVWDAAEVRAWIERRAKP